MEKNNHTPEWERILQVVKYSREGSISAFARRIGLNRGENLFQIKRGNNRISRELAERIAAHFPEVSKAWLLTGEGSSNIEEDTDEKIVLNFKIVISVDKQKVTGER